MYYQGSRLLSPISSALDVPIDQINFVFTELFAVIVGLLFRKYLPPSPKNTLKRHLVEISIGLSLDYFCYGINFIHVVLQSFVSYLLILYAPRNYVHLLVFFFTMGYLTIMHIQRQIYDYGHYTVEVSGAVMIATQKLTSLAFSYYDGMRDQSSLTKDQLNYVLNERPTTLEFMSYMFNFQGVLIGPLVNYRDYVDFITGNNFLKYQKAVNGEKQNGLVPNDDLNKADTQHSIAQPNNKRVLLNKLLQLAVLIIVYLKFTMVYTADLNLKPEMLEKPVIIRYLFHYLTIVSQRSKYYLAWVLADLVHNASGLGFNGYDEKGAAKWDMCTSVNILTLETSTSLKMFLDNWNIPTQLWFRRIAYDRMPTGKTLAVFFLSAFWHGFYPGYYLTFILAAFLVYAGRGIRQNIRPMFQKNLFTIRLYAVITWIAALWGVNYGGTSFLLLDLTRSFEFYKSWYWHVHIVAVLAILLLPSKRKTSFMASKKQTTNDVNNNASSNENLNKNTNE